jgi:hypothetical protein
MTTLDPLDAEVEPEEDSLKSKYTVSVAGGAGNGILGGLRLSPSEEGDSLS